MNIAYLLHIKSEVKYLYDTNTLRQGLEKMREHGYTAIPVISKEGDYVGTISEGDFLWHIIENGQGQLKEQEKYQIKDIIREDFIEAVSINASAEEVIEKATNQNFVPVVDDRDKFIGIVTRRDIINYFMNKQKQIQQAENANAT
ncbi:MAG: CBS domain-containing protein [Ruminococcus sp.]